ncbi:MAG TPA: acyl-CoA reductase, partial [Vicinamibacteria bacterium]
MAVDGAAEGRVEGGIGPRLTLGIVTAALLLATLVLDLPRASKGEFFGDGATYYGMAWSLARDLDLRFEARDLERIRTEYPGGPQGVFLKRASGGLTLDAGAGFPWVRRVRADEGRLYYAKAFAHSLVAAPLVAVLGTRGLVLANGLLLSAALWLAFGLLKRRGLAPWPAAAAAAALLLLTVTPVYLVWPTPEILGLAVVTAALAADPASAAALALDTATWDQRGCLSPQLCFVAADRDTTTAFAARVAAELARLAETLPPARLGLGDRLAIRRFRD